MHWPHRTVEESPAAGFLDLRDARTLRKVLFLALGEKATGTMVVPKRQLDDMDDDVAFEVGEDAEQYTVTIHWP